MSGRTTSTRIFTESILSEYGIKWITRAGITKLEQSKAHYQTLDGEIEHEFDFAMIIPAFSGVGIKAFAKDGAEITSDFFAPNGFIKVDADYKPKDFEDWSVSDWPSVYHNLNYVNMFAAVIGGHS